MTTTRRRVIAAVVIAVVLVGVYFTLGSSLTRLVAGVGQLPTPHWTWIGIAVASVAVSYLLAALALQAAAGRRLPLGRTTMVELAAAAANRVTPAGLGGAAISARFLTRSGMTPAASVASVGMLAASHGVVAVLGGMTVVPLLVSASARHHGSMALHAPHAVLLPAVGVGALALVIVLAVIMRRRQTPLVRRAAALVDEGWRTVRQLGRDPARMASLLALTFAVRATTCFGLVAAMEAFDGDIRLWRVAAVYFAGSALAAVTPTPSGLGSAEFVLVAGLVAVGGAATIALAAVVVFRLISFWGPILPGVAASAVLRRRYAL